METERLRGLETLLRPSSVAVIGASEDPFTYSGAPIANLLSTGFSGRIHPVNLTRDTVQGIAATRSVVEVPEPVDTAIIVVPTAAVLPVLEECVQKGIRTATIVSSGFGEAAAGAAGAKRAAALQALIAETGIRILGPNTAGLANLLDGYVPRAANNGLDPDRVRAGGIALVSQSGAMGNTVFNRAQAHGVGIGLSAATGGQIDVDVFEIAALALEDPRIRVAALIVETLESSSLEQLAERARVLDKAIVVLRLGRSDVGRQAVMTHSGSLAGDDAIQAAALRQLGVVDVHELDDLWHVAQLVEIWGPAREPVTGLGVVALSGGEGALIADCCSDYGLELSPASAAFGDVIDANFDYAMASNPFDPSGEVIGRPEKVQMALRAFIERNTFSDVLIASPVLRPEIAARQYADLEAIVAEPRPRIALSYWEAGDLTDAQAELLRATRLPVFESSRAAIRSLALYASVAGRTGREVRNVDVGTPGALRGDARYFEARTELERAGIAFDRAVLARSLEEAVDAAISVGLPVAMKANVVSSTHKFANGLLSLGLLTVEEVEEAYGRIAEAGKRFHADGVVVEAVATGQVEVMLGAHRDQELGAVVVVGSGGSMVEYLDDSALAVVRYMSDDEALSLVRSTRIGTFLGEASPKAVLRLAGLVETTARWFEHNTQLSSLDLNPLLVDLVGERILCVDARVA